MLYLIGKDMIPALHHWVHCTLYIWHDRLSLVLSFKGNGTHPDITTGRTTFSIVRHLWLFRYNWRLCRMMHEWQKPRCVRFTKFEVIARHVEKTHKSCLYVVSSIFCTVDNGDGRAWRVRRCLSCVSSSLLYPKGLHCTQKSQRKIENVVRLVVTNLGM